MRKTMRNVTMVVPVLITSCHVSLKPNRGPLAAQITTMPNAVMNAIGRPVARAVVLAKRANHDEFFIPLLRESSIARQSPPGGWLIVIHARNPHVRFCTQGPLRDSSLKLDPYLRFAPRSF